MKCLFTLFVILSSFRCFGQIEVDTVKFRQIETRLIDSLDSLNLRVIDTLIKPQGFILSDSDFPEFIAIEKDGGFVVFDLLQDASGYLIERIERVQVDGSGYEELVVYWEHVLGHSGPASGMQEETKGIMIYDLNEYLKIFEEEYFYSNVNWSNVSSDSSDAVMTYKSHECNNFEVEIADQKIYFELKKNENCEDVDKSEFIYTKSIFEFGKSQYLRRSYE